MENMVFPKVVPFYKRSFDRYFAFYGEDRVTQITDAYERDFFLSILN